MNGLTVDMIDNALMTSKQCTDLFMPSMNTLLIFALGILIVMGTLAFILCFKYYKLRGYIKDNKLEKKYQEWKADNKGLE